MTMRQAGEWVCGVEEEERGRVEGEVLMWLMSCRTRRKFIRGGGGNV